MARTSRASSASISRFASHSLTHVSDFPPPSHSDSAVCRGAYHIAELMNERKPPFLFFRSLSKVKFMLSSTSAAEGAAVASAEGEVADRRLKQSIEEQLCIVVRFKRERRLGTTDQTRERGTRLVNERFEHVAVRRGQRCLAYRGGK